MLNMEERPNESVPFWIFYRLHPIRQIFHFLCSFPFHLLTDTGVDNVLSALIVSTLSFACFRVMKKKGQRQKSEKELVQADSAAPSADAFEEEVNSGFGSYLRSAGGENRIKEWFW